MKECPKCKSFHTKPGTYCSRKCANSRTFSEETKEKKRIASKKYAAQFSSEEWALKCTNKTKRLFSEEERKKIGETTKRIAKHRLLTTKCENFKSIGAVKKKLILEKGYKCVLCGLGDSWKDKPLTLEIDHIDGCRKNNKIENIRLLCPNCHSQTNNFRGRAKAINNKNRGVSLDTDQMMC
jgi:hypothetical protein